MDTFMQINEPFRYAFGSGIVSEDLSELREETDYRLGGDQGLNDLHVDNRALNKYPRIRKILMEYFEAFNRCYFGYNNEFVMTTSWMVRLKPGDTVREHWHANSFYSGLLYYGEYEGAGDICFSNPIIEQAKFYLQPGIFNNPMHQEWSITPETNLLVFFPSFIKHHVDPYQGKRDRLSVAFNIVPRGRFGVGDSYLDTAWTQ